MGGRRPAWKRRWADRTLWRGDQSVRHQRPEQCRNEVALIFSRHADGGDSGLTGGNTICDGDGRERDLVLFAGSSGFADERDRRCAYDRHTFIPRIAYMKPNGAVTRSAIHPWMEMRWRPRSTPCSANTESMPTIDRWTEDDSKRQEKIEVPLSDGAAPTRHQCRPNIACGGNHAHGPAIRSVEVIAIPPVGPVTCRPCPLIRRSRPGRPPNSRRMISTSCCFGASSIILGALPMCSRPCLPRRRTS